MVRPAPSCTELAGESPARVGTGAPGSRLQPTSEIPSAERSVESLRKGGATKRAATLRQACSLVRVSAERRMGGPSRSCHGEGNRQRAESGRSNAAAGTPRGMERSTLRQLGAEQERPSLAAPRRGEASTYKANAEGVGRRQGVRGARSTDEGGVHKPPEGEGPALVARATGVSVRAWL